MNKIICCCFCCQLYLGGAVNKEQDAPTTPSPPHGNVMLTSLLDGLMCSTRSQIPFKVRLV